MTNGFRASHDDEWENEGLAAYETFSDKTTDCLMEDIGDGTKGCWFYIPEERLANGCRVIYNGTWGNDNSPGADCYTYATTYEAEDEAEYQADKARWEAAPEWDAVESDEDIIDPDWVEDGVIAAEYEGGLCPDCCEIIRPDTQYGEACDNCDHVFNKPGECDDFATR